MKEYYETFKDDRNNRRPKYILGNKCENAELRQVKEEEAIEFALKYDLKYAETSAKIGLNVEKVFK